MADDGRVPFGDAISSLCGELMEAMRESRGGLCFALGPVELEFQLVATIEVGAGGGVRFWLVNADAKASRATGSTDMLKVTLTPVHASKVPVRHRGRAGDVRADREADLGAL